MRPRLSDVPTVVAAAVWVVAARVVISRHGFSGAVRRFRLEAATDVDPAPAPLPADVHRAAWVAHRVVRLPLLGGTCLPRSIAMARVVAKHGSRADLVLGVASARGTDAHAWVEAGGERIDPSGYAEGVYLPTGRFVVGR